MKDFETLVSLGLFNSALMNDAVYKFKRYEDSSLSYAGINKHAADKDVGLFDTVLSASDYARAFENIPVEESPAGSNPPLIHETGSIRFPSAAATGFSRFGLSAAGIHPAATADLPADVWVE